MTYRYTSGAPAGTWDPMKAGHVLLIQTSFSGSVAKPTGIDLQLYNIQVKWWDAKINLNTSDMQSLKAQADVLRALGAKDTDASKLLAELNQQAYDAHVEKYDAIVNLDNLSYKHADLVLRAAKVLGATLATSNTGLDKANERVLKDKVDFWDAKMIGRSTDDVVKDANAARALGATITGTLTELDKANQAIADAKATQYQGWVDGDAKAQQDARAKIFSEQSRGNFCGQKGLIGNSTSLDTLNQKVIDAKIAWWQAKADGNDAAMQKAANNAKAGRDAGSTIPVFTHLDTVNQKVFDGITAFQDAYQKYDYVTAAQKLIDVRDAVSQGATIGLKKQSYMTQTGLNLVLFYTQSEYWQGLANEDKHHMDLATDAANFLRNTLGAKNTTEASNMATQNLAMLTAKKNYWKAYADIDQTGMKNALTQIATALTKGATLSGMFDSQLDKDNQQIILDKVNRWIVAGDSSLENPYVQDANNRRSKANSVGAGSYLLPSGNTKLDQAFSDWYDAKKGRWNAQATGADQNPFINKGHASFQKIADFDSQSQGLILSALTRDGGSSNDIKLFNIDIQNDTVLDNRDKINQYIADNKYSDAKTLYDATKKLTAKGATLDISKLVTLPSGGATGNDMLSEAESIIFHNEGAYNAVNRNDNGALSIGHLQWHADRALDLLRQIRDAAPADAKQRLGSTSIWNEINNSNTDWSNRVLTSTEATAISGLLNTSVGHSIQDSQAAKDIQGYFDYGKNQLGITDSKALIYFADLCNQGSGWATNIVTFAGGGSGLTLDKLHQEAVKHGYEDRRNYTYNTLKNWNSGTGGVGGGGGTGGSGASGDPLRQAILDEGTKWVGKIKYMEDGNVSKIVNLEQVKPEYQDCSSFVGSVYLTVANISLPRTTYQQINSGTAVSQSEMKRGDLIFFNDDSHVGIYMGDGTVLHCGPGTANSTDGVKITALQYMGSISHIRRIIQ